MVRSFVSLWRHSKLQHMKSAYSKSWRWKPSSDPTLCSFFSPSGFEGIILLPLNMDLQYHCTEHPRRHDTFYLMSAYFKHWKVMQGDIQGRLVVNNYIQPLYIWKKTTTYLSYIPKVEFLMLWHLHHCNVNIFWSTHQNLSQHECEITAGNHLIQTGCSLSETWEFLLRTYLIRTCLFYVLMGLLLLIKTLTWAKCLLIT